MAYLNHKPNQSRYPSAEGSGIKAFSMKRLVNHYELTTAAVSVSLNHCQVMGTWPKQFVTGGLSATVLAAEVPSNGKNPAGWDFNSYPYDKFIVKKVDIKAHFRNTTSDRIRVWYYNAPHGYLTDGYDNRLDTWEEASELRKVKKFILYPTSPDNRGDNHYVKWSLTNKHFAGQQNYIEASNPNSVGNSSVHTMSELFGKHEADTLIGLTNSQAGPCARFRYTKDTGADVAEGALKITFDVVYHIMFFNPKPTFDPL